MELGNASGSDNGSSRPDPPLRPRERPWHDHFDVNNNSNHNINDDYNHNIQHVHYSKFHDRTVHVGSTRLPDRVYTCRACSRRGYADGDKHRLLLPTGDSMNVHLTDLRTPENTVNHDHYDYELDTLEVVD